VEITAAASTRFLLKRVRVSCGSANSDDMFTFRICLMTSAGSNGTAYTPVPTVALAPAATSTVKIKDTTVAFTLGTVNKTFFKDSVNGRAIWEWIPRGDEEYLNSGSAGIIAVIGQCSAASKVVNVNCVFEE
jgi:hypothetical protein